MYKTLSSILLWAVAMLAGSAYAQTQPAAPVKKPTTPAKSQPANAAKATGKTPAKTGTAAALTTRKDKFSYALGMSFGVRMGQQLKQESIEYDPAIVARAVRDALSGDKMQLTEEQAKAVLNEVSTEVGKKHQDQLKQLADTNKKEGDAFLAANKAKEGVVTLPSGLEYKILKAGTGPKPTATDTVSCNYRGTFVNGTEFDSSAKGDGKPVSFPVNGVIKGWTEALQLMPVGSKWQLFIPPDLAYGPNGRPGIPPNSTLVFDVELVSIQEKKPEAKAPDGAQPDAPDAAQPKTPDKPQQ